MQWNACLNNVNMTIYSNKSADSIQNVSKFYLIFWRGEIDKSIGNSRDPEQTKQSKNILKAMKWKDTHSLVSEFIMKINNK